MGAHERDAPSSLPYHAASATALQTATVQNLAAWVITWVKSRGLRAVVRGAGTAVPTVGASQYGPAPSPPCLADPCAVPRRHRGLPRLHDAAHCCTAQCQDVHPQACVLGRSGQTSSGQATFVVAHVQSQTSVASAYLQLEVEGGGQGALTAGILLVVVRLLVMIY